MIGSRVSFIRYHCDFTINAKPCYNNPETRGGSLSFRGQFYVTYLLFYCVYVLAFLPSLQFTFGQVLSGHSGAVTCLSAIALFSDGDDPVINTLIASGSADSTVCIWERPDPKGMACIALSYPN